MVQPMTSLSLSICGGPSVDGDGAMLPLLLLMLVLTLITCCGVDVTDGNVGGDGRLLVLDVVGRFVINGLSSCSMVADAELPNQNKQKSHVIDIDVNFCRVHVSAKWLSISDQYWITCLALRMASVALWLTWFV